jgi:UMF1 family MFS transporter
LFGLDPALGEDARITGPIAAVWYLIFVLPMFFFTPDQARAKPLRQALGKGLSELRATLDEVRQRPGIARFLIARMVYQDGVTAIIALGAGYAASMFQWSITEIGLFGMIINVMAIFSCFAASRIVKRFGSKTIVMISLVLLLIASAGIVSTGPYYLLFGLLALDYAPAQGLFATSAEHAFLIYGITLGAAFGPVQASSRSWFARSIRPQDAGRYFGIYALAGRATSFIGPFLVATVTAITHSAAMGMSVLVLFFSAGIVLAARTPYPASA